MDCQLQVDRKDAKSTCKRYEFDSKLLQKTVQVLISDVCDVEDVADSGSYVQLSGWIQISRFQGKIAFILLRDGTDFPIQVMIPKDLIMLYKDQSQYLKREASVTVIGTAHKDKRAPTGLEIHAIDFKIVGKSAGIDQINNETKTYDRFNNRHLVLREEATAGVMKIRHYVSMFLREFFMEERCYEVTPPTLTQSACEGGSSVFAVDFFDSKAGLSQSGQLYIETMIPIMKRVFCIMPSYRAEQSVTRRHLAEYTHVEAEFAFLTFDELLSFQERMVVHVMKRLFEHKEAKKIVSSLNPKFSVPNLPFKRIRYSEAIKMLGDLNEVCPETGKPFKYGDDITDLYERKILEKVGEPFFLTHFPHFMKSFYMDRDTNNTEETESADLLYPGMGEIIGGSMRLWDYDKLLAGFEANKINPAEYQYYIDQRRYGSCKHGGFGLGLERLIMCICAQDSVKECCMYPRYFGRCGP